MEPINYNQDIATPFQSAMQGFQAGTAIQDTQFKQRAREQELQFLQQQHQFTNQQHDTALQQQRIMGTLASNPNATADDYAKVITMIPANREGLAKAWEIKSKGQQAALLGDLAQYGSALQAGRPDLVYQAMNQRADAMEKTGGETNESRVLRAQAETIKVHPELGFGMIKAMTAMHPDGKTIIDGWASLGTQKREADKAPAELVSANAKAVTDTATANVASPRARADLLNAQGVNAERIARLGLDTDKFTSEMQLKVQELNRKPGMIDLPESAQKIVNESASSALVSRQVAAKSEDLAAQLLAADPNSFAAGAQEWIKKNTGMADYVSQLRNETNRMLAGDAMRAYRAAAPGTFSDADLKQAMKGLPDEKTPVAQMASYLRGVAKIQNYNAQIEDARADWISQVGSPYKSNKDIQIGDIRVPRGTTFNDFVMQRIKPVGAQTQPEVGGNAASRLMQKYGGGATGSY
jgi:hypothetical protein